MAGKRNRLNFASAARAGSGKGKKAGAKKEAQEKHDATTKKIAASISKKVKPKLKAKLDPKKNLISAIKRKGLKSRGGSSPRTTKRR